MEMARMLAWPGGQMSPPRSHRVTWIAVRAIPWAAGPLVLVLRCPTAELAAAPRCAGLVDLTAIVIAGRWPDLHAGTLVTLFRVAAVTVALGCFAELAIRATRDVPAAIAATLAL